MSATSGPLIAYRWFRVTAAGTLAGAQHVQWPADAPLRAEHIFTPAFAERNTRHRRIVDAALWTWAVVACLCSLVLVATAVWLLAVLVIDAWPHHARPGDHPLGTGRVLAGIASALACAALAAAPPVLLTLFVWPRRSKHHTCPCRPRRFGARLVPECGIYGYRTFGQAAAAMTRERFVRDPMVLGRVTLGGLVYPHSEGFRAELGRVDALFDDAAGHVQGPAARYGVPVLPPPPGVLPAGPGRPLGGLVAAVRALGAGRSRSAR